MHWKPLAEKQTVNFWQKGAELLQSLPTGLFISWKEDEISRGEHVCKGGPICQWVLTEYETRGALFMTGLRITAKQSEEREEDTPFPQDSDHSIQNPYYL